MWGKSQRKIFLSACIVLTSLCLGAPAVHGQETLKVASPSPQPSETAPEVRALSELIYDLQAQVQTLNSQLNDLRTEQQRTSEEARELRRELDLVRVQTIPADKEAEL